MLEQTFSMLTQVDVVIGKTYIPLWPTILLLYRNYGFVYTLLIQVYIFIANSYKSVNQVMIIDKIKHY